MDVVYNPAGITFTGMEGYIQWASFLWDLRTQLDVTWSGTTSATTPSAGQALIRMATAAEWASYNLPQANGLCVTSGQGKLILFAPDKPITHFYSELVIHEVGHALGYFNVYASGGHSPDSDDIMYPRVGMGNFPVSSADAFGVSQFSTLPRVDKADILSAVLRWDNDLYIPDIMGKQVQLDYTGVKDLGTGAKHTWKIWSSVVNEDSIGPGSPTYVVGNTAHLHSIQSVGQDYTDVTMTIVGSQVQLDSWTLA